MKKLLFALFCVAISLAGQAQNIRKFEVQGNRGARGIMPENTIEGMLKALDLGVNSLKLEVVISGDGQAIVSQEPYFNHEFSLTPAGKPILLKDQKKYNIFKMDFAQIKKFDVGTKVHPRFPGQAKFKVHKPLLGDLLDAVEAYVKKNRLDKPAYTIETKLIRKGDGEFQPDSATFIETIMAQVKKRKLEKRVTIQSFDIRTLQYLHQKYPKIKTALGVDEKSDFENNIAELGFKPSVYAVYAVLVGKNLVDKCHERGIRIIPWTVNSVKQISYFKSLGVDGITTDYPNLMGQIK